MYHHLSVSSCHQQVRWKWTTFPSRMSPWWPPTRWLCCWPSTTAKRCPTRSCRMAPRWTRRSYRRPSSPCWTSRCSTMTHKRSELSCAISGIWIRSHKWVWPEALLAWCSVIGDCRIDLEVNVYLYKILCQVCWYVILLMLQKTGGMCLSSTPTHPDH